MYGCLFTYPKNMHEVFSPQIFPNVSTYCLYFIQMTAIELQLAIDRLKVELGRSSLEENEDKQELRKNIVELQMKLQHRKDEEEEEVGVVHRNRG